MFYSFYISIISDGYKISKPFDEIDREIHGSLSLIPASNRIVVL